MALNAKVRDRREGTQIPVPAAVSEMAAQTLQAQVLVSCVEHLGSHGMIGMLRPVMAGLAEVNR